MTIIVALTKGWFEFDTGFNSLELSAAKSLDYDLFNPYLWFLFPVPSGNIR